MLEWLINKMVREYLKEIGYEDNEIDEILDQYSYDEYIKEKYFQNKRRKYL